MGKVDAPFAAITSPVLSYRLHLLFVVLENWTPLAKPQLNSLIEQPKI